MQLLFTAPHLTAPTFETLKEYGSKRFEKLNKFLPKFDGDVTMRVSVRKEGRMFVVQVEVSVPKLVIVTIKHEDLRRAIDFAYDSLKKTVVRTREKMRSRR